MQCKREFRFTALTIAAVCLVSGSQAGCGTFLSVFDAGGEVIDNAPRISGEDPKVELDREGFVANSGFLTDYSKLTPSREKEGAYSYNNPQKNLRLYKMFMIDPVQVQLKDPIPPAGFDRGELDRVARNFEAELRSALGPTYPVVQQPGFGVLRMRAAITDVTPADPALNILPIVRLAGFGFGGASIEAEFLDGQTNEQVAAFVDTSRARAHWRKGGLSRTGHAEDCLREWALFLRDRLDVTKGLHKRGDFSTSGTRWR